MNERVQKLRQSSLEEKPWLSTERAEIVTDVYRRAGPVSMPILRAMTFQALMERKTVSIGEGELIVGERGPGPKGTPTFPELCCHSLEDLDIISNRPKIAYRVSSEARRLYAEEIIPFWRGKTMRERLFQEMQPEWVDAYEAGVFTEFMEQRAPGHTVADGKIYRMGFLDFKKEAEEAMQRLDFLHDPQAYNREQELKAMILCCDAIICYGQRYTKEALRLAAGEDNPQRRAELERIVEVCSWVPAHAPRDFWEALQMYWFVHLGVVSELNTWDSFCPGHLDRHLQPFYQKGLATETLNQEQAKELLECLWVKFNNQPAPPKVGVTAEESGTYTDFANINTGGLLADGSDGVSDVTYLILEVIDEMHLLQPSSNLQLSAKNPDRFLRRAVEIIRQGWGQPSLFNADKVVEEMLRAGKTLEDAREGGISGCVETGAFGKEAYILTGYFNLVKVLEITLHDGWDPRTNKQIGLKTGDPVLFSDFEELYQAFQQQMAHFLKIKIRGNQVIERLYATFMPAPFLSVIVEDCIQKGRDYNDGGPRYNSTYIMGTGTGSLTDSLSAIRTHVYEQGTLTMADLLEALEANFQGHEKMRQLLWNKTPRYGNDDPKADELLVRHFNDFCRMIEGIPNTKGGSCRPNFLSTTCHVYFGSLTGATPDGRRAWAPLSDGISPVQGADKHGPTAVIQSAAKLDQAKTGGTLLNQKFTPSLLEGEDGIEKLAHLVRAYFRLGGHHIQFNVVTAETLRAAQAEPEKYRDLIVRVAGYSDYFCDLTPSLQEEIIARTEQPNF
jgi:pyruvate formate-lyase/glycerol dehydratase family glycyl radical enzyme